MKLESVDILSEPKSSIFFSHESNAGFHHERTGNPHRNMRHQNYPKLPIADALSGTQSNTLWLGPTKLTIPNDSSIASRIFAHQRHRFPLVIYNGLSRIHLKNCRFPIHPVHSWTHPTRLPNHHRNLLSCFSTIRTNRPTHRRTYTDKVWTTTCTACILANATRRGLVMVELHNAT